MACKATFSCGEINPVHRLYLKQEDPELYSLLNYVYNNNREYLNSDTSTCNWWKGKKTWKEKNEPKIIITKNICNGGQNHRDNNNSNFRRGYKDVTFKVYGYSCMIFRHLYTRGITSVAWEEINAFKRNDRF